MRMTLLSMICFGFAGCLFVIYAIMERQHMLPDLKKTKLETRKWLADALGLVSKEEHTNLKMSFETVTYDLAAARTNAIASEAGRRAALKRAEWLEQRLEDTKVDSRNFHKEWLRSLAHELEGQVEVYRARMDTMGDSLDKSYMSGKSVQAQETKGRIERFLQGGGKVL